jgi:uncharacterized protein (TIGR03086 family)
MTTDPDIHALDAAALAVLGCDVETITTTELHLPTPCAGWNVKDLIDHMNTEHQAILEPLLGPSAPEADSCAAFATATGRWIGAFGLRDASPPTIWVPKFGVALPADAVLHVHFMDMIVHRWDLSQARATPFTVSDDWLDIALAFASSISADSPLRDPRSPSYAPPLPTTPETPRI